MPTVKRIGNLRVVIYPNVRRSVRAHVVSNDSEAVFQLHCPDGLVELRENYGFPVQALDNIQAELSADLAGLCNEWKKLRGHP